MEKDHENVKLGLESQVREAQGLLREKEKDYENLKLQKDAVGKEKDDLEKDKDDLEKEKDDLEKEKAELQDYQSLIVARGLVEKTESFYFKKRSSHTQYEKWHKIATGGDYQKLKTLLDDCGIDNLPDFVRNLTRESSGLIHNFNVSRRLQPPTFFGRKHSCFFKKLVHFCEENGINLKNFSFSIESLRSMQEDMDRFWEEEGKETKGIQAFSNELSERREKEALGDENVDDGEGGEVGDSGKAKD